MLRLEIFRSGLRHRARQSICVSTLHSICWPWSGVFSAAIREILAFPHPHIPFQSEKWIRITLQLFRLRSLTTSRDMHSNYHFYYSIWNQWSHDVGFITCHSSASGRGCLICANISTSIPWMRNEFANVSFSSLDSSLLTQFVNPWLQI